MNNPMLLDRLSLYAELVRLYRPIGILLLLWPGLWALWIAGDGSPTWWIVAIFIAGTALMRSAGCAINDYADRDLDGHVTRTRERPLASGRVSPKEAVLVFVTLSISVASSSGTMVRGSITSALMPSLASVSAAASATCTIEDVAISVMSDPSRLIFASPKGIRYSSSGTGALS